MRAKYLREAVRVLVKCETKLEVVQDKSDVTGPARDILDTVVKQCVTVTEMVKSVQQRLIAHRKEVIEVSTALLTTDVPIDVAIRRAEELIDEVDKLCSK